MSTLSLAEAGYPFGSVVPYCLDRNGLPVFLFSHLAQHSRNLERDARCALTVSEPVQGDVQQGLRLTCLGDCSPAPVEDTDALSRYFRYFPAGRIYFEELNFRAYRLVPRRFHYNGGFATARWVGIDRILQTSTFDAVEEARLIKHIRRAHPQLLRAGSGDGIESDAEVQVSGVDPWGLDLRAAGGPDRIAFPRALHSTKDIDAHLRDLP